MEYLYAVQNAAALTFCRVFRKSCEPRPWEAFGEGRDIAALFYDYWRAFLRVSELVRTHGGDVLAVIEKYGRAPNK